MAAGEDRESGRFGHSKDMVIFVEDRERTRDAWLLPWSAVIGQDLAGGKQRIWGRAFSVEADLAGLYAFSPGGLRRVRISRRIELKDRLASNILLDPVGVDPSVIEGLPSRDRGFHDANIA